MSNLQGQRYVRVFQNVNAYPAYLRHLDILCPPGASFEERRCAMQEDGLNGVHLLEPVMNGADGATFTCGVDETLQRQWSREHGLVPTLDLNDILLAQIEHARAEVFYTQTPHCYGPPFLKRLPGCVRKKVCWMSPPAPLGVLTDYDLVLNNFPTSLAEYGRQGARTAYFTPSFDPGMAPYCDNQDRPIDVAFVGGYTRHHRKRAAVLDAVASLRKYYRIHFAFDRGRLTRLAETSLGRIVPALRQHGRPRDVQDVSHGPLFGRSMYELFSRAKIVLNGAVDSAAGDRGNIRCFEAMGCGALLLTDSGRYPEGMVDGDTMRTYHCVLDALSVIRKCLQDKEQRVAIAQRGLQLMRDRYSKAAQWKLFQVLVS
jgi:hypothetical protein